MHDIDLGPDIQDDKVKEEVGFYVHHDVKFIDMASLVDPHPMRVSLSNTEAQECVRITVKNQTD